MGYSVGKWDGDALVVETSGFNGKTWLDQAGHPATEALHVTERFRRPDFGHLKIEVTINDPEGLHQAVDRSPKECSYSRTPSYSNLCATRITAICRT